MVRKPLLPSASLGRSRLGSQAFLGSLSALSCPAGACPAGCVPYTFWALWATPGPVRGTLSGPPLALPEDGSLGNLLVAREAQRAVLWVAGWWSTVSFPFMPGRPR